MLPADPEKGAHGVENGVAHPFSIDATKLFEANEVRLTSIPLGLVVILIPWHGTNEDHVGLIVCWLIFQGLE